MFQCLVTQQNTGISEKKRKLEIALRLILNMDKKNVNVKLGGNQVEVYSTLFVSVNQKLYQNLKLLL